MDLTFIKELDGSGFIDRLYKTTVAVASREEPRSTPANISGNSAPGTRKNKSDRRNDKIRCPFRFFQWSVGTHGGAWRYVKLDRA